MHRLQIVRKDHISIDINSLSFLLGTEDQNLAGELSVEEASYEAAIAAINKRSRVHRHEEQLILDVADIKNLVKKISVRCLPEVQRSISRLTN